TSGQALPLPRFRSGDLRGVGARAQNLRLSVGRRSWRFEPMPAYAEWLAVGKGLARKMLEVSSTHDAGQIPPLLLLSPLGRRRGRELQTRIGGPPSLRKPAELRVRRSAVPGQSATPYGA